MHKQLLETNIHRLLWQLSIPAILGMLSSAIFNVVDRIFVGKIDSLALTGVGITMPIQILQMAIVLLIGIGSSTLISIRLGQNKVEEAESILYLAFKYIIILLIVFAVGFVIFLDPILSVFSVSEQVMPYAKGYIVIIILGGIIGIPGYCLNNSLRAIGKAAVGAKMIAVTSVLNIILDPIFIFVFDWGVAGAAWATVLCQTILTLYITWYFCKAKGLPIYLKFGSVDNEWYLLKQIAVNGAPSFYVQVLATFVNAFVNWSLLRYGTDLDIAAVTIMSTIFSFYHMIVMGIVQGNQPICGYNWGAERYDRVAQSLKLSLVYAFGLSVILFLVILFIPQYLVMLFTDDHILIQMTNKGMKLYYAMLPLIGLQTVSAHYFQAVGKSRLSSFLAMLRYGIILVPMMICLAPYWGVYGIYMSNAISDGIASLLAIGCITWELKTLSALCKKHY